MSTPASMWRPTKSDRKMKEGGRENVEVDRRERKWDRGSWGKYRKYAKAAGNIYRWAYVPTWHIILDWNADCNAIKNSVRWRERRTNRPAATDVKAIWAEDRLAPSHSLLQTHNRLLLLCQFASSTQTCFISLGCVLNQFHIKQAEARWC